MTTGRLALQLSLAACLAAPLHGQVAVGDSLWQTGRIQEATAAYERAIETDRFSVRANVLVARSLAWSNNIDSALVLLRNARVRVPDDPDIRYSEALYLSWAQRFDEALLRFDSLLTAYPDLDYVRAGRARTLSWAGRFAEAEQGYRELLARNPTDRDAARDAEVGLAQVTSWRGDLGAAATRYEQLIADDPADPRALQGLASVRSWSGRPISAVALLERAIAGDSTNPELRSQLAAARIAAAPTTSIALDWSDDTDGNRNTWLSVTQNIFLSDRFRGTATAGHLRADGAGLARRTLGELSVAATLDRWRVSAAVGARSLDPESGGTSRTAFTLRGSAGHRVSRNVNAALSVSHQAFDEIAALIARRIDLVAADATVDITARPGGTVTVSMGTLGFSDANRRYTVALRTSQRLAKGLWVGALGRTMQFTERRAEYFSPGHLSVAELQGGWDAETPRWSGSLGTGFGRQSTDPAKPWQDQYHVDMRVARRWANGNAIAATGGVSTSAASSAVGAYRYRTAGISATLVW